MEKIYEHGDSVHVGNYILYADTTAKKIYTDTAKSKEAKAADVVKAFKEGKLLINDGTGFASVTFVNLAGTSVVANTVTYTVAV